MFSLKTCGSPPTFSDIRCNGGRLRYDSGLQLTASGAPSARQRCIGREYTATRPLSARGGLTRDFYEVDVLPYLSDVD